MVLGKFMVLSACSVTLPYTLLAYCSTLGLVQGSFASCMLQMGCFLVKTALDSSLGCCKSFYDGFGKQQVLYK